MFELADTLPYATGTHAEWAIHFRLRIAEFSWRTVNRSSSKKKPGPWDIQEGRVEVGQREGMGRPSGNTIFKNKPLKPCRGSGQELGEEKNTGAGLQSVWRGGGLDRSPLARLRFEQSPTETGLQSLFC